MTTEDRPNPEALLKAIEQEATKSTKGRLKIFLGMAAGVGKTYAMLEEAQKQHKIGLKPVIGVVNTHGRVETAQLVEGLTLIPEKKIEYRGTVFEEFDIDAVLKLKPPLVLIDELAHTNVVGSRHPKRWQDVLEILDNGIDVFTTLNVQHIESLKDVVEPITEIMIRETVPDLIIETATSIELIDIPPEELLQRLKEGKVYLGSQSEIAARHFFQEDRLTALREIVLRYAAEKVDHDLHGMVSTIERPTGWKPRERLLVAVSHSPHSQRLIRTTRRLAFNLNAPWLAVHVDDGRKLEEEETALLHKNISLARDLGAEVVTTTDPDVSEAIQRIARLRGVTQLIIGRTPKGLFSFKRSLLDQLATNCKDIDIHVIRQTAPSKLQRRKLSFFPSEIQFLSYFLVFVYVLGFALLSLPATILLGYRVNGFVFLLGILFLSLFFSRGPIFVGSILFVLLWDFFFIPPTGSFAVNSPEDAFLLGLYLLTAFFTSVLMDISRKRKALLIKREESAQALYDIARDIAGSPSFKHALELVKLKLESILNGKCEIILKRIDDGLIFDDILGLTKDPKEKATADWVFQNGKEAGWSTTTLPSAGSLYLPLKGYNEVVGVLAYQPNVNEELSLEEKNFIYTSGQLLATRLERSFLEERRRKQELSKSS